MNMPFENEEQAVDRVYMSAKREGSLLWRFVLFALLTSCVFLGVFYYGRYGLTSALIFGFIFLVALVVSIILVRQNRNSLTAVHDRRMPQILERVFDNSINPAVLYERDKPVRANAAYLNLAQALGVETVSGAVPSIDKLFQSGSADVHQSLFRLHNSDAATTGFDQESINMWVDGQLTRYVVRASRIGGQQYWEVLDQTQDSALISEYLTEVPVGLLVISEDGDVLATNDILLHWMGLNAGDTPLHIDKVIEHADGLLNSPRDAERTIRFDTRLFSRKGVATPVVLVASWRKTDTDRLVGSIALHGHSGVNTSRSAAKLSTSTPKAEGSVQAAESGYSGAPFAVVDLDGSALGDAVIVDANASFVRFLDRSDWSGMRLSDLLEGADQRDMFAQHAGDCQPDEPFDLRVKGRENMDLSAYVVHNPAHNTSRVYLVDITARKSLEDQLVQSQKMQAIGRLVAEIAHDFNNLLAAMRLYTDTLLGRHPIGDPSYGELQQINANVNRAAALVKKLLAYSRKQTMRAEIIDVSEVLSEMGMTLRQMLGEKIRLDMVYGRNIPQIKVDRSQLDQVLMNLAVNARDAIKSKGGGTIKIESRKMAKSDVTGMALRSALKPLKSDELVVISVTDDGTGMPEDIKSRIFEPFFTTKEHGEGTGLGLATVYGIVQQSGGYLDLESELGSGTTFTIYLPAVTPEDVAATAGTNVMPERTALNPSARRQKPVAAAPKDLAGQGDILFVEDEDSVRIIAAKTLRKRGYNVTEASDGEEAYELIEMAEKPFDLMISDVVMPGMDGPTLLKKARPMLAETRIVFISGYAEEEFSDLLAEEPDVTFLPKPFSLIQLAEKVKAELG